MYGLTTAVLELHLMETLILKMVQAELQFHGAHLATLIHHRAA